MFSCVSVSTVNSSNLAGRSVSPWASQVALVVKNLTANAGDIRDPGWIPGLGRSPGGGHGNPLQYSCLGGPHGQSRPAGLQPMGLPLTLSFSGCKVQPIPDTSSRKPASLCRALPFFLPGILISPGLGERACPLYHLAAQRGKPGLGWGVTCPRFSGRDTQHPG